jgi:hypothetical protein
MPIVRAVADALQWALGPSLEPLALDAGAIRRRRKFTGAALLRAVVLTALRTPRPRPGDYLATAASLGVVVTPRAIGKRFTPGLVAFLRLALERILSRAIAADPADAPLLARFSAVLVGDSTTVALPDDCAAEFPGCGGKSGSGKAAVKIQVVWDLCTGRLARMDLEPGRSPDSASPAAAEVPPVGSLTIRDLGYFDLGRFRRWAAAGAHWLSRWQPGTVVAHPDGRPLDLLGYLGRLTAGARFDGPVLLGAEERLPCRLIALRAPEDMAARRRRKLRVKAAKSGAVPGRERLAWCDWTVFVTDCPAELLGWREAVVLYRGRWQVELLFKLWKSHNHLATAEAGASPWRRQAEFWARLIGVVLQHWVLLTTSWPDCRRSLWKAAGMLRAWMMGLIDAWDDRDRLVGLLRRLGVAIAAVARVDSRKKHPSWFQLLADPERLDWTG